MTTIQLRRGTAAQWTAANPALATGEMGLETDTGKFKFGDGTALWNALAYYVSQVAAHSHTASNILDSTVVGRSVLTAVDAAAARTAIGAGTSSLALGSTGTTAKAGNWFPSFAEVTGVLGTNQLPPLAINDVTVVANQAAMLALTAQRGDMAIRTDNGLTYVLATDSPATLADWKEVSAAGQVQSVAGKTGAVTLAKADVGLSNVDNTADTAKPVSTAQQTALNAKENTIAAGTIGQYYRGDKTWATNDKASVGLANVDNTSDASKPVSTAQQTALNLKANLASPTFTGTVGGITKAMVGLSSVDNTADSAKPVSTAQQTALNGKENTIAAGSTAQYWRGDKTWQPIANIDVSVVDGGAP